jgi:hypothetical protein
VQGEDEERGKISQRRLAHARGSVLVVDRARKDLEISIVQAMCQMIDEVVVPLIAANCNGGERGRKAVLEAITLDMLQESVKE